MHNMGMRTIITDLAWPVGLHSLDILVSPAKITDGQIEMPFGTLTHGALETIGGRISHRRRHFSHYSVHHFKC